MRRLLCAILIGISGFTWAQRESYHWYFGNEAGLLFTDQGVSALTDGKLNTTEGCASISDSTGNLLFYTDGFRIWNRKHEVMEDGLKGDQSSTQAAVIVANPEDINKYFIFTTDGVNEGLLYSEVDMQLKGGLGDVTPTIKNRVLLKNSLEKITAVKHPNQVEYWLIAHKKASNSFHVYKITETGSIENTGVYPIGATPADGIGYMKISPNGRNLAIVHSFSGKIEVFDFDGKNGSLSNARLVDDLNSHDPYGLEFSPDGTLLYTATTKGADDSSYLLQYSLNALDLPASKVQIKSYDGNLGALQLAADGRIYVAKGNSKSLGIIQKPNQGGWACNYEQDGISLDGKICRLGLPGFIQSYFIDADFVYEGRCSGQEIHFHSLAQNVDSVVWDFGDPSSGSANTSRSSNPKHSFQTPGNYKVQLYIYVKGEEDSYSEVIAVLQSPTFELGPDTFYCDRKDIDLTIPHLDAVVMWNDKVEDDTHQKRIEFAGTYWAQAELNGCVVNDTVKLDFYDTPEKLYEKVLPCQGELAWLEIPLEPAVINWNTGLNQARLYVQNSGDYWAEVRNPCGVDTSFFEVQFVDCNCKAWVPNAVSLNQDGLNEHFKPTFHCELELDQYRFEIYNRWGERVFSTVDINESFDPATVDGNLFLWMLQFSSSAYSNNVSESMSGILHVIQ